jgi:HEAT repeat protein
MLPLILCFALDGLFILNFTYADSLFLSTYPHDWLIYYYIADPINTILLFFCVSPFLAKANSKQLFLFTSTLILVLMMLYMLKSQHHVLPFILSLSLYASTKLLLPIGWNAIATSLDMRFFKNNAFYFSTAGSAGSIATALFIPVLIHYVNTNAVFYLALSFILLIAICLLKLKPLPHTEYEIEQKGLQTGLMRNPLFISLTIFTILSLIIPALAQFSFQTALMGRYSQAELATFLSLFNGVISITCLLIQSLLAKRLLSKINLVGVLLILPITCALIGLGLSLFPVFALFIFFNASQLLLGEAFMYPCREIMLNPFPSSVRKKANMIIRGYATPIGGLIGAVLIYLIQQTQMDSLGLIVFSVSLGLIYFTIKTTKNYQQTLYVSLKENRYSPELIKFTPASALYLGAAILKALNSSEAQSISTALSFFNYTLFAPLLKEPDFHEALLKCLHHPSPEIRSSAARAYKLLNEIKYIPILIESLRQEVEPHVCCALIDTLYFLNPNMSVDKAGDFIQHHNIYLSAYGVIILDNSEIPSARTIATQKLQEWLKGDLQSRLLLATIELYLHHDSEQNSRLKMLIDDQDNAVAIQAIKSLKKGLSLKAVLPNLIECVNHPKQFYFAMQALTHFPEQAISVLLAKEENLTHRQFYALIRLLAQRPSNESVIKLIHFATLPSPSIRQMVSQAIESYGNNLNEAADTTQEIRLELLRCIAQELKTLLRLYRPETPGVLHEIAIQLKVNRNAFVTWFSTFTDKNIIERVRNYIVSPHQYAPNEVAKAYELLDSLAPNSELKALIETISMEYQPELPIANDKELNQYLVLLETQPFTYRQGIPMNTFDKVCLLRQISLFSEIPAESLQAIAEIALEKDFAANEVIFSMGDVSHGFYCIVSGAVTIKHHQRVLAHLKETDYFGELGSLDNSERTADALGASDGLLLYIPKEELSRILDDFPDIMRAIVAQVISYLRSNLSHMNH